MVIDQLSTTPISDGIQYEVAPDEILILEIDFLNTGNRHLTMTPYQRRYHPVGRLLVASTHWKPQRVNLQLGRLLCKEMDEPQLVIGASRFATDDGFSGLE